jgi:hypothetical protein
MKSSRSSDTAALGKSCLAIVLGLIGCTCLSGCVSNIAFQGVAPERSVQTPLGSSLMIIEVDEVGPIFHEQQRAHLESWLERGDPRRPFVVFVHGWHHNAEPDDKNLKNFTKFLGLLEEKSQVPVDGLYIGWRGDSFDLPPLPEAVDFVSIWGRKRAAGVVGRSGVDEILKLVTDRRGNRSLTVIGHSLGGDAVFRSVQKRNVEELADGIEYFLLNPAISENEFSDFDQRLRRFTMGYSPSPAGLLTTTEATRRAHRKVTVFQALGDRAIGFFYRLAFGGETPIGFDPDRQTHIADVCEPGKLCSVAEGPPECTTRIGSSFVVRARGSTPKECDRSNRHALWVISGAESVGRSHNHILTGVQAEALAILIKRTYEDRVSK